MTLLLVMLHTGTMFAVIAYFWKQWKATYFRSTDAYKRIAIRLIWATVLTAIVGEVIIKVIEKTILKDVPHAQIEDLFNHLEWVAPALAAAGVLILIAGLARRQQPREGKELTMNQSGIIGAVQGLCLPFRGFSRSGATISTGMLAGGAKERVEAFSFALAVILTPPVVIREALRLRHAEHLSGGLNLASAMLPGLLGALFAFLAGLLALKWLSRWLEGGRWYLFGIYCLLASGVVFYLHHLGY
jgi:undecaprenyl-diphosphatase